MNGFRSSHAVIIGINGYQHGIPQLRTAVNDARHIAQVLDTQFGYAVQLLTENVTLAKLRVLLGESLPAAVQADDRLLLYFAGHGIALDGDDGPAGYIVAQDARPDDRQTFLPMAELSDGLNRLPCRHLLLVLDCCFAGAFRWSSTRELGAVPDVIHKERFDRYIRDAAWQVITSAAYDQRALDVLSDAVIGRRAPHSDEGEHSPFAAEFLRAIQGEADLFPRTAAGRARGDGVITATELYLYLRGIVEEKAEGGGHRQTPGLWPLKKHDKGEYIHLVPGHELNLPPAPELNEANNPYRGLQSYDEEHAAVFCGRSEFVRKLAERVVGQPLTTVLGASGTGKSSVVKAGLISLLRATERGAWQILSPIRPGKSPLASLASVTIPGEQDGSADLQASESSRNPDALAARVGAWAAREPAGRLLLVVDQFEELITLCTEADERDRFLQMLERALEAHSDRLRIVLTLRSDFEPQFTRTPLQHRWMTSAIVVPAMTLDEYREVIEGPASVKVIYFKGKTSSQEFINRLIGDVANTPGALPLLSFTLSELYRRYLKRGGDDRALWAEDYESLGGVGGSLRNRANEVYDKLPDDGHRKTMRKVMLRMISVEGGELARRHVPDDELVYGDLEEDRRVHEVIRSLTEARLVVVGKDTDDQPFVEPAHDELVRGWDKLLAWSREEAESLQLRRRLAPAAQAWERGQAGVWATDPRLRLLHRVLKSPDDWLNAVEARFVRRSWFWRRAGQAAVALAFLVLSGITRFAFYERDTAYKRERIANAERLAALSSQVFPEEPQQCLILATEAIRATRDFGEPIVPAAAEALQDALASIQGAPLNGHQGAIEAMGFTHDGRLVTAGYDQILRVWNLNELAAPPVLFSGHTGPIETLATSRSGLIATGSVDGTVRVWDPKKPGGGAVVLRGHKSAVRAVAFTPDGLLVSAGQYDNTVRVWNLAHVNVFEAQTPEFRGHNGEILSLAVGPSGLVATGSADSTARVWDLRNPKAPAVVLEGKSGTITSVAFSHDGRVVTGSATPDNNVKVWDVKNPTKPIVLKGHPAGIHTMAFANDGQLVTGGDDGTARVWNMRRLDDPPLIFQGHERGITALAFAPNGRLVTASLDKTVRVWKQSRPDLPALVLRGHEQNVQCLAFAPDGRLVTGSRDQTARIWNWKNPARNRIRFEGNHTPIADLAFAPDGRIVSVEQDPNTDRWTRIVIWDPRNARAPDHALPEPVVDAWTLARAPEGLVAIGGVENAARVWDSRNPEKPTVVLRGHKKPIRAMAFTNDQRLVTGSLDGTMCVWNLKSPAEPPVVIKHEPEIAGMVMGPNGILATRCKDQKNVWVWDLNNPTLPPTVLLGFQNESGCLFAFTADGRLVTASQDRSAWVWDVKNPSKPVRVLPHYRPVKAMALAPDGRLGTGEWEGAVRVWDLKSAEAPPVVLRGHESGVTAVAFASDGTLATGSWDKTIRVWDIKKPVDPLVVLRGQSIISQVGFAPDGRLAAGYGDGTTLVWELDTAKLLTFASEVASRNLNSNEWQQFFGQDTYRRTFSNLPDGEGVTKDRQAE